uniref:Uncharacterized protein n=1 Tax=Glossina austeni TaxID=7395 RepID=A0A1A9VM95_GLOAU
MPYGCAEVPPAAWVLGILNGGGVPEWKFCFSLSILTLLTGLELLSVLAKRPSVIAEYATEPKLSRPAPKLVATCKVQSILQLTTFHVTILFKGKLLPNVASNNM